MSLSPDTLRQGLVDRASQIYRGAGRFAYYFARAKLGGDPIFLAMLERGLIPDHARILDLGCGQGLLAAWLLAARQAWEAGEWPAGWPTPGRLAELRGVDLRGSDIRRAQATLGAPARFEEGDMCAVEFGQADAVVIMDVLRRVGDASAGFGFRLSNRVDRAVAFFRGNPLPPLHCRPLPVWIKALEALGFNVETVSMNGNLPFANVMLIARLGGPSTSADVC